MIDTSILIHLFLAFAVGSLWVIAITVIAEKKGSVVGGILGGLPSTSAFSFFFIGINQSSATAVQATTVFPISLRHNKRILIPLRLLQSERIHKRHINLAIDMVYYFRFNRCFGL